MKPKWWFVIAGLLLVIVLIVSLNLFVFSGTSAASYVAKNFERVQTQQQHYGKRTRTYQSEKKPTDVAAQIVDEWQPQSQHADGSGIYLRYPDDAIVIQPKESGSRILVMEPRRAYGFFFVHIGGPWGWTSPHGDSFRGRGPGAGK